MLIRRRHVRMRDSVSGVDRGAQITCFTGTKVQILTQKLVAQAGGLGRKWRRGVVSAQTAAAVGLQMQART